MQVDLDLRVLSEQLLDLTEVNKRNLPEHAAQLAYRYVHSTLYNPELHAAGSK